MFLRFASVAVGTLQILIVAGLVYYYVLLVASLRTDKTLVASPSPRKSFAIAIPAHNEEAIMGETLQLLNTQDYPSSLYDVFVVADHCDDNTADAARRSGAICYERNDGRRGRKAYALRWLLERILACENEYHALVVFDADSRVDEGFLRSMNVALDPKRPVLQGRHVIANPEESAFSGLADVDMRLNNLLRNEAKQNLGLSCRLMGDAMCFSSDVVRRYGWPADSLGEDREYGLYLLTRGIRVGYVPEAISVGQAAPGWKEASTQRLRWYGGVFEIQKEYALKLLRHGLRGWDWAALEQAVELLLPSFSVLALLSGFVAGIQWVWSSLRIPLPLPVSTAFILAWALFPFLGLWIDRAPASSYRALLHSPRYLLWRLWLGLKSIVLGERVRWVRTPRHEEVRDRMGER